MTQNLSKLFIVKLKSAENVHLRKSFDVIHIKKNILGDKILLHSKTPNQKLLEILV